MAYDGVLFDFDGVIIQSGFDYYQLAFNAVEKPRQQNYDGRIPLYIWQVESYEELKREVSQTPFSMEEYLKMEKAVTERKIQLVKSGKIPLVSGANKVVQEIDVPTAVASNAYLEALNEIIPALGMDKYLDYWTGPCLENIKEDLELMKPETALVKEAMSRINAEDPLLVGDSPSDIKAAQKIGIDSVAFTQGNEEFNTTPTYRISNLEELLDIVRP